MQKYSSCFGTVRDLPSALASFVLLWLQPSLGTSLPDGTSQDTFTPSQEESAAVPSLSSRQASFTSTQAASALHSKSLPFISAATLGTQGTSKEACCTRTTNAKKQLMSKTAFCTKRPSARPGDPRQPTQLLRLLGSRRILPAGPKAPLQVQALVHHKGH